MADASSFPASPTREMPEPDTWQASLPRLPSEYERGFGGARGEGLVCSSCITDVAVREAVSNLDFDAVCFDAVCDYCGGSTAPFAQSDILFEYVYRCLLQEYDDPLQHGIWPDKEQGGWIGITELDIHDVFNEVDGPFADDSSIAESFDYSIEHDWYKIDSEAGTTENRLIWSWDSFEKRLLTGPRFLFSATEAGWREESAESLFQFLDQLAKRVTTGFIKTHDPGLVLLRARSHKSKTFTTAEELGSPPACKALPQRMSAAGVPSFYASEDDDTAIEEVKKSDTQNVSVGRWITTAPLLYADFATRPTLPSLFDYPASKDRPFILFLWDFVKRIKRPASNDIGDANSYLATQVLAEYLRYSLPVGERVGIDAVRYPSSARKGGVNWVVFGQPDRESTPLLNLIDSSS